MFVVDTNIFLYAVNKRSREHPAALASLEEWRVETNSWFATWSILYEFLRVSTHARIFERPLTFAAAWGFVEQLFESPSFGILTETNRHAQIVRGLSAEYPRIGGNSVHDFHIVALMREHGVNEIRTTDTDFHQFRSLRVVNPLP